MTWRKVFAAAAAVVTGTIVMGVGLIAAIAVDRIHLGFFNGFVILAFFAIALFSAQRTWRAIARPGATLG